MSARDMDQKTAVFTIGSLAADEPRSYDVDEPTRELPLIAGRFAGREWVVEDLQREYDLKKEARGEKNRRWVTPVLGAAAAVALLIGSLLGQAGLVDVNEEAAGLEQEITVLQQEQTALRVQYAQAGLAFRPGREDTSALLTRELSQSRDKATVLNVRRGHELQHLWNSVVDTLGESFR